MPLAFKGSFGKGARGRDVAGVKRTLILLGYGKVVPRGRFGAAATTALKSFQRKHKLNADGVYGPTTHAALAPLMKGYGRWLYAHAKARTHPRQVPPLPRVFYRPLGVSLPGSARWGLQPWIVPQVEAICKEFSLTVTAGYGGSPPHARFSDHKWGGAVDLVGSRAAMVRCNEWADGLRGHTFRWVGGPAHDADGVEAGHSNHVHLSWYSRKATSIFGTSRFKA